MLGGLSEERLLCRGNPSHVNQILIKVKAQISNFLSMETGLPPGLDGRPEDEGSATASFHT
eukprot:16449353-Heterocapsa_arctica.AAC.1